MDKEGCRAVSFQANNGDEWGGGVSALHIFIRRDILGEIKRENKEDIEKGGIYI